MSKNTLVKEIRKEVDHLNSIIDLKIIKGLNYKNEARRHKFLVRQLQSLTPVVSNGWIHRVSAFVSTFAI